MPFKGLLIQVAIAFFASAILVSVAYFFVDRPVAYFVHDQGLRECSFLKWLTYLPEALIFIAPLVLVLSLARFWFKPLTRHERVFLASSIGILFMLVLVRVLKIVFGRYWPETWTNGNPSLIQTGEYGFHPFHYGIAYAAFPSGHTAQTVAVISVLWHAYPRYRLIWVAVSLVVVVGLVGVNYHFVGDTIGGAFLGGLIGTLVSQWFRLRPNSAVLPTDASPTPSADPVLQGLE